MRYKNTISQKATNWRSMSALPEKTEAITVLFIHCISCSLPVFSTGLLTLQHSLIKGYEFYFFLLAKSQQLQHVDYRNRCVQERGEQISRVGAPHPHRYAAADSNLYNPISTSLLYENTDVNRILQLIFTSNIRIDEE